MNWVSVLISLASTSLGIQWQCWRKKRLAVWWITIRKGMGTPWSSAPCSLMGECFMASCSWMLACVSHASYCSRLKYLKNPWVVGKVSVNERMYHYIKKKKRQKGKQGSEGGTPVLMRGCHIMTFDYLPFLSYSVMQVTLWLMCQAFWDV